MNTATFQAFQAHAASSPFEVCGLVLDGPERYFPCRNIAEGPDEFRVHPEDWATAEDRGAILAVCHSHPGGSCKPSTLDLKGCELADLPYLILGVDGLWRLDPLHVLTNLTGRNYRFGWSDCWTLVRDFFGASMPDLARDEGDAARLYHDHHAAFGWHKVPLDAMQAEDVLFLGADHAAVYLGGGKILHHRRGRLSRIDHLRPAMIPAVSFVLRRS